MSAPPQPFSTCGAGAVDGHRGVDGGCVGHRGIACVDGRIGHRGIDGLGFEAEPLRGPIEPFGDIVASDLREG